MPVPKRGEGRRYQRRDENGACFAHAAAVVGVDGDGDPGAVLAGLEAAKNERQAAQTFHGEQVRPNWASELRGMCDRPAPGSATEREQRQRPERHQPGEDHHAGRTRHRRRSVQRDENPLQRFVRAGRDSAQNVAGAGRRVCLENARDLAQVVLDVFDRPLRDLEGDECLDAESGGDQVDVRAVAGDDAVSFQQSRLAR